MRLRWLHSWPMARSAAIALAVMLAAGRGDAAPTGTPVHNARIVEKAPPRPLALTDATPNAPWALRLGAIDVKNRNTNAQASIRLYSPTGAIDQTALHTFMRTACSVANLADKANGDVAEPLDVRVVQLVFRAAYHFKSTSMTIVSAMRRGPNGKHRTGDAIDFQLEGVSAAKLAAYVRSFPRAGVGIYTHPKTQYVHVDVRDHSYHWLDGSPPGITWREQLLADPTQQTRDASYAAPMDLPDPI